MDFFILLIDSYYFKLSIISRSTDTTVILVVGRSSFTVGTVLFKDSFTISHNWTTYT